VSAARRCAAQPTLTPHTTPAEWDSPAFQETAEFKHLMNTEWRNKVNDPSRIVRRERRVMELYRAWECEAAVAATKQ
jgi:hypothetical protein